MNIVAYWKKQIEMMAKKETRAILLLSYRRSLKVLWSYGYILMPLLSFALICMALPTNISLFLSKIGVVFLSQMIALLLRPSMYKKDTAYLTSMLKNNALFLLLFPVFSLIIPFNFLPWYVSFLVFFQLIAADGAVRLISMTNMIKATLLLLWYNLPPVFLIALLLQGMVLWMTKIYAPLFLIVFFGVLMLGVSLLVLFYTASIYEHEGELF